MRCLVWLRYHGPEHSFAVTRQSQHPRPGKQQFTGKGERADPVAQFLVSWLLVGGRFRIHAINGVGRRKGRIIEVEVIATGERFHGSAQRMERLVRALQGSNDRRTPDRGWSPGPT
jgi:hypothetical protein